MHKLYTRTRSRDLAGGYGAYAAEQEVSTMSITDAPAITPATPGILSVIAESSVACGIDVSVIGGSAISMIAKRC